MRPGQLRLCQSKEHLALGTSKRNLENQGCCRGPAWSLSRGSGSSQTGQKVAPLGAAKKKKKKVLRLTDTLTPNLPRSASGPLEELYPRSVARIPSCLPWTCCYLSSHLPPGERGAGFPLRPSHFSWKVTEMVPAALTAASTLLLVVVRQPDLLSSCWFLPAYDTTNSSLIFLSILYCISDL